MELLEMQIYNSTELIVRNIKTSMFKTSGIKCKETK